MKWLREYMGEKVTLMSYEYGVDVYGTPTVTLKIDKDGVVEDVLSKSRVVMKDLKNLKVPLPHLIQITEGESKEGYKYHHIEVV